MNVLHRARAVALDLLFPPECAICRRGGALICDACIELLPRAEGARCRACWAPAAGGERCRQCGEAPLAFASLHAPYTLDLGARRLVHRLKYEGLTSLAAPMAALAVPHLAAIDADVLIPVPLHAGRLRVRGYNQAAELGKYIASAGGLPFDHRAATRVKPTAPLARTMSRDERRRIVQGAFRATPARVEGKRVLLVDDVATTGATLDACAVALLEAGAVVVHCVTWARAG